MKFLNIKVDVNAMCDDYVFKSKRELELRALCDAAVKNHRRKRKRPQPNEEEEEDEEVDESDDDVKHQNGDKKKKEE